MRSYPYRIRLEPEWRELVGWPSNMTLRGIPAQPYSFYTLCDWMKQLPPCEPVYIRVSSAAFLVERTAGRVRELLLEAILASQGERL